MSLFISILDFLMVRAFLSFKYKSNLSGCSSPGPGPRRVFLRGDNFLILSLIGCILPTRIFARLGDVTIIGPTGWYWCGTAALKAVLELVLKRAVVPNFLFSLALCLKSSRDLSSCKTPVGIELTISSNTSEKFLVLICSSNFCD